MPARHQMLSDDPAAGSVVGKDGVKKGMADVD